MPIKTLYEFYKEKGQALPSVAARAPLAAQYGITNYAGTAEQNNALLARLTATGAAPGALPPASPLPGAEAPGTSGGPAFSSEKGAEAVGDLGNLRIALREALNEAGRKRIENSFKMVAPFATGTPGTIGSVVDMIRAGVKSPIETTFSDIVASFKDASEAKQKEIDRINELRKEFGSAVPSSVTDLKTALDLVAPLVDKERKIKLDKMASEQAEDNDIESWAESFAKGEIVIGNVPSKIRTAVKVRADVIKTRLEGEAKQEYKDRIAFRLEKKTSDFETERSLALQDDNLTVVEQREVIEYIDTLEQQFKAAKKQGGKGFFNFLNPPAAPAANSTPTPWSDGGQSSGPRQNFTPSAEPFKELVKPFSNLLGR